jgi:hypothetical protein
MGDLNVDVSKLPEDVREKLAELDLELSEGKLFGPYLKQSYISINNHILWKFGEILSDHSGGVSIREAELCHFVWYTLFTITLGTGGESGLT